jgi:glutaredoxin
LKYTEKHFVHIAIKQKLCAKDRGINILTKSWIKISLEMSFLILFPTARTFPQIKIDGSDIGGYTELEAWSKNKE